MTDLVKVLRAQLLLCLVSIIRVLSFYCIWYPL